MRAAVLATAAGALAACQSMPPLVQPTIVKSQDQAASVEVTEAVVAPWGQVSSQMQPNFTMTGDTALQQVEATTSLVTQQVVSSQQGSLAVGLSPSSAAPGAPPSLPTGAPAGAALPGVVATGGTVGIDAEQKYDAAKNLNQFVQIRNIEIPYAALERCYVPYLVDFKYTVHTYRSNLPYAIDSRVAFFPSPIAGEDPPTGDSNLAHWSIPSKSLRNAQTSARPESYPSLIQRQYSTDHVLDYSDEPCLFTTKLPKVVPILATDDLERTLKTRAVEAAEQIQLALSFAVHGAGGAAGYNNLQQALQAISSQDFNSRMIVARQNDNTLMVEIGPTNQATAGAALVPQTYDVALILLVPRAYFGPPDDPTIQLGRQIRITTYSRFSNVLDGSILAPRPPSALQAQLDDIISNTISIHDIEKQTWSGVDDHCKVLLAQKLIVFVQNQDEPGLLHFLYDPQLSSNDQQDTPCTAQSVADATAVLRFIFNDKYEQSLWTGLSSITSDSVYKNAYFTVDWPIPVNIPNQTALLMDDTKQATTTTLANVDGATASTLVATLEVTTKSPATTYDLPAQSVTLNIAAHTLALSFPSLSQYSLSADGDTYSLIFAPKKCRYDALCPAPTYDASPLTVKLAKSTSSADAPADFSLTSTVSQITAVKGGTGVLTVSVSKISKSPAETVSLSLNADVVSAVDAKGAAVPLTSGAYTITSDSVITFTLRNLHNGQSITVSAQGKSSAGTTKASLNFTALSG